MRVSDVVAVNHDFRHYRKAITMRDSLANRMAWVRKNMPEAVTPSLEERLVQVDEALSREISGPRLAWEINTYLSRRPLLLLPVKQIMRYVFDGIPEPKPAQHTPLEQSITELMTMRARQTAANQHRFAVMLAIAHAAHNNHYMIFNTLTVRPGAYYEVFTKQSTAFKDYIRAVDRACTGTTDPRNARRHHGYQHQHFACVEEGSKHGRLHIHCLHILDRLPRTSSDPNTGAIHPRERELPSMRNLWRHGLSKPLMVRYSPTDAFGQAGYRWPLDYRTGDAQKLQSPLALANYLSKYINEGYNSCQRAKLLWRVRKSHKLGHAILLEMLEPLSTSTLLILANADNLKLKLNNQRIPQNLIRRCSLTILQNRQSTTNLNGFHSITDLAKTLSPRLSPLHYSRASTPTIHASNQQNMQYLSTIGCDNAATFEAAWDEVYAQRRIIDAKYFPRNNGVYGKGSTRDNILTGPKHYSG